MTICFVFKTGYELKMKCEHEIELTASPWHYDVYYCEACGADMGLDDE